MKKIEKRENGTIRVCTINQVPDRTQQQFKDDHDINVIVKRLSRGIVTPQAIAREKGMYADMTSITDYHESMNKVIRARDAFMTLPADIRARCGNDPGQVLGFFNDPKNYDDLVKAGVMTRKEADLKDPKAQPKGPVVTEPPVAPK